MTSSSHGQPSKAFLAITLRGLFLKNTSVSDVHPANARFRIKRLPLLEISTLARLLQPLNASDSMSLKRDIYAGKIRTAPECETANLPNGIRDGNADEF